MSWVFALTGRLVGNSVGVFLVSVPLRFGAVGAIEEKRVIRLLKRDSLLSEDLLDLKTQVG